MSISKSETDVILNRANVALARSQRLVASWLPQKTNEELANVKSEEELQREEDEIFTAVPETLGVGAPLPNRSADGSWNRTELSSNEKLRKQLLGRNYEKVKKATAAAAAANHVQKTSGAPVSRPGDNDDDDDDNGRTTMLGGKKRKITDTTSENSQAGLKQGTEGDNVQDEPSSTSTKPETAAVPSRRKKKATSFLDEILADRSKKRKKK
ncbi:hypothetical protein ASPZODRAFT_25490 [Penicilliopsis zonata CBS 506.65]|uniref:Uncharacterized protein n=1 Tax=Penicilliopsis zonata CBS 506.65 TaxID=1073090 RepID=A0A1L9SGU7_9EURO|nr:hypothetical protein ASPZODRAFT_25490 [Penicilliopsis zonata CBS 506.65]OJJ46358.1 hypothetical protein ASPZODRAFT_25490 [Penicilliopsis zonata CBS 506.65]